MVDLHQPGNPAPAEREDAAPAVEEPVRPPSSSGEETGCASFPASDPPAVWTWEVKHPPEV